MANYASLDSLLNETTNMTKILDHSPQDDGSVTVEGVPWLVFQKVPVTKIYVNGNSWIGLGSSSEHLKVCRRDTKLWDLYREEALLFGFYKVLKIRWEGYSHYNTTAENMALRYEWLFFDNGDYLLHILAPVNSGYLGTSQMNGIQIPVQAGLKHQYFSFYHQDAEGVKFVMEPGLLNILPPFERKYLLSDKAGKIYRMYHQKALVDALVWKGEQYLSTKILPNQDTKVKVTFLTEQFGPEILLGAQDATGGFSLSMPSATEIKAQFGTEVKTQVVETMNAKRTTLELSKEGVKLNEVLLFSWTGNTFQLTGELLFGCIKKEETCWRGNLYLLEIWQGITEVFHLVPCVEETLRPCLCDTLTKNCFYPEGYGMVGYQDATDAMDKATLLEEVSVPKLTADVFQQKGFEDLPREGVWKRLVNPTILYWQDSAHDLPAMTANATAIPPVQVVYSKNTKMSDPTILGIEKVTIEADPNTLFAFSFDGGVTWKAYVDLAWVTLSEETSGMTKDTVEAIGTDAWAIANQSMQYQVRFALLEGSQVTKIVIHYVN